MPKENLRLVQRPDSEPTIETLAGWGEFVAILIVIAMTVMAIVTVTRMH